MTKRTQAYDSTIDDEVNEDAVTPLLACPYASAAEFDAVFSSMERGIRTAPTCDRLRRLHANLLETFLSMQRTRGCAALEARFETLHGDYTRLLVRLCIEAPRKTAAAAAAA